jgi:hypothetical protein
MKRKFFLLCQLSFVFMFVSCEKYEFPDSDLTLNKRNLDKTLIGSRWELKKLLVNGYDSTKYIADSFPGPKILKFGFGNYSYNGASSDYSSELIFNQKRIWNCEFKIGSNNGLTVMSPLYFGGLGVLNPQNFIERLGPNRQYGNYYGGFYIRKLTMQSLILTDNDQLDSMGLSITNLYFFERR